MIWPHPKISMLLTIRNLMGIIDRTGRDGFKRIVQHHAVPLIREVERAGRVSKIRSNNARTQTAGAASSG